MKLVYRLLPLVLLLSNSASAQPQQVPQQAPQQAVRAEVLAGVLGGPMPTPDEIAALERQVATDPKNLALRAQLITKYNSAKPFTGDRYSAARLATIEFIINEYPADPLAGRAILYSGGAGDHANIAALWRTQANRFFDDSKVILNAIRFLQVEDKQQAEDLFQQAISARPTDRELTARLGFFYAAGLVGADTMDGRVVTAIPEAARAAWKDHCHTKLENSRNPRVLLGASIALPNLSMLHTGGGAGFEAGVHYSKVLTARAAQLEPGATLKSMPVEFQMFATESQWNRSNESSQPAGLK